MYRDKFNKISKYILLLSTLFSILSLLVIAIFLLKNGLSIFKTIGLKEFIFNKNWAPTNIPPSFGILPMILGSIYVTFGAILIGAPIGVLTAVFLVFFIDNKYYKTLKSAINLMAGIPSIIYGFFGLTVLVPLFQSIFGNSGNSILTASVLLGIMILPTIVSMSESAIRAVPKYYLEGALALGASKETAILKVVLPAANSGIISSIILGIGRAIGETMAVVMVSGNQARMPKGILKGTRTLTANIVMEMSYASGAHRDALIATALILFIFILILNITFSIVKKEVNK